MIRANKKFPKRIKNQDPNYYWALSFIICTLIFPSILSSDLKYGIEVINVESKSDFKDTSDLKIIDHSPDRIKPPKTKSPPPPPTGKHMRIAHRNDGVIYLNFNISKYYYQFLLEDNSVKYSAKNALFHNRPHEILLKECVLCKSIDETDSMLYLYFNCNNYFSGWYNKYNYGKSLEGFIEFKIIDSKKSVRWYRNFGF